MVRVEKAIQTGLGEKKTQSLGTLNFQRVPHVPIAEVSGDPAGPRASFVHRWSPVASQSL